MYYKRVMASKYNITTIKDKRLLLVKTSKEIPIKEKSSTIIEKVTPIINKIKGEKVSLPCLVVESKFLEGKKG